MLPCAQYNLIKRRDMVRCSTGSCIQLFDEDKGAIFAEEDATSVPDRPLTVVAGAGADAGAGDAGKSFVFLKQPLECGFRNHLNVDPYLSVSEYLFVLISYSA